jgi:hypothetical protein
MKKPCTLYALKILSLSPLPLDITGRNSLLDIIAEIAAFSSSQQCKYIAHLYGVYKIEN